jgi:CheY-like chemotaxis protein
MGTGTSEHRHTVLLVDDHEDLRDAFLVLALSSGVNAVAVAGGREALTYLKTAAAPPCVIVLDLSMPDMDGLAFRREQSSDPALADIPVVVLSGAGPGMEAEARQLGLHTYLTKPVEAAELFRLFSEQCSQRAAGTAQD